MRRGTLPAMVLGALIALWATPAFADLEVAKTSTKEKGATSVTWNSSFVDVLYDCGQVVLQEANLGILVNYGDAAFVEFIGKNNLFTPKKDVAGGYSAGGVFTVDLSSMHYDEERDVFVGNVHLKMLLEIDADGLPGREATLDGGVNIHLERPGAWGNCS
jgi:hypothetical protein